MHDGQGFSIIKISVTDPNATRSHAFQIMIKKSNSQLIISLVNTGYGAKITTNNNTVELESFRISFEENGESLSELIKELISIRFCGSDGSYSERNVRGQFSNIICQNIMK